jgi:hypothetical protein
MAGAQLSLSMMMSCTLLLYTQHWTQYPLPRTYIYRTPATSEWICVAPIPPFFPQRTRRRILVFQKLIPTNNGRGFTEIQIERCPLPASGWWSRPWASRQSIFLWAHEHALWCENLGTQSSSTSGQNQKLAKCGIATTALPMSSFNLARTGLWCLQCPQSKERSNLLTIKPINLKSKGLIAQYFRSRGLLCVAY